jgi:hypothetical protein
MIPGDDTTIRNFDTWVEKDTWRCCPIEVVDLIVETWQRVGGKKTTYRKSEYLLEAWTINAVDNINKEANQPSFLQFSQFVVINRALSLYISQLCTILAVCYKSSLSQFLHISV